MSEAADQAEKDVEDFFNEEIFGAKPPVENEPPFPQAEPEPKPLEEVVLETPDEAPETPEEVSDTPTEDAPEQGEDVSETPEEVSDIPEDDEAHLAWARKKFGEGIDLEGDTNKMLAKAAYEQEKLLGKQAEERRRLEQEAEQREIQERITALNTPGVLTAEEDIWVDEATQAGDPGEYAYDALQSGRPDLYAAVMDRWSTLGEVEARRARALHSQVLQLVSVPQPSEQESYTAALGGTFVSLGLNIERDGPLILQKAEELGAQHPSVQGMMSTDEDVRRIATRSIYDLVAAGKTVVHKAKQDDVVQQRVQEEQLRQNAAGVNGGGAQRIAEPKKSSFWEQFDAEIAEKGWDGQRPTYGREE